MKQKNDDMLIIMKPMQSYMSVAIGNHKHPILSGGDQLMCERQRGSKQYVMDGDTTEDRLYITEPVIEDWHALLKVHCIHCVYIVCID